MGRSKRQNGPDRWDGYGAQVRIAGIVCDPGPDAEDRLRRLTAILLKLAHREGPPAAADLPHSDGSEEQD